MHHPNTTVILQAGEGKGRVGEGSMGSWLLIGTRVAETLGGLWILHPEFQQLHPEVQQPACRSAGPAAFTSPSSNQQVFLPLTMCVSSGVAPHLVALGASTVAAVLMLPP